MKFDDIVDERVNLSDNPPMSIVVKLLPGDEVLYESEQCEVLLAPQKQQKGIWIIGLRRISDGVRFGIRLVEPERPRMTNHEKKVIKGNIKSICEQNKKADETKMIELVSRYYWNLNEHNKYDLRDIRECMGAFPKELLKKSGIVL